MRVIFGYQLDWIKRCLRNWWSTALGVSSRAFPGAIDGEGSYMIDRFLIRDVLITQSHCSEVVRPSWRKPTHCVLECVALVSFGIALYCFLSNRMWAPLSFFSLWLSLPYGRAVNCFYITVTKIPKRTTWRGIYLGLQFWTISAMWWRHGWAWHGRCPDLREFLPEEEREWRRGKRREGRARPVFR